jgi:hypothetical protein
MNPNRQYLYCFINIYLQLKAVLTFLGRPLAFRLPKG